MMGMQEIVVLLVFLTIASALERPSEDERVRLWHERNTWPPTWQTESAEYRAHMERREEEIMKLTGADERWENWMQYIQARMTPKFTETGFDVAAVPATTYAKLKAAVDEGIRNWSNLPFEENVKDSIYGPLTPKMVHMGELAWEAARELKSVHEDWAGMKLKETSSYGVRLYQKGASMVMHNDRVETHVISSIVHIAHEYDNDDEPWPIEIEDHDGNIHAVNLEPGQMLFYESAKCLHGRRSLLKGAYYGSIFIHYQPVEASLWNYTVEDVIANVPPHWGEGIQEPHGSRWAGQGITVDSRIAMGAPPRVVPYHHHHHQPLQPQQQENQPAATTSAGGVPAALVAPEGGAKFDPATPWQPHWQPKESPTYRQLMEAREREIMQLTGADERWTNWLDFAQQRLVFNFTQTGFEVRPIPAPVYQKLKLAVDEGLRKWDSLRPEPHVKNSIYGPLTPKFIDIGSLAEEVSAELLEIHEDWATGERSQQERVKLKPSGAYGVRLYRRGSSMVMHNDKIETHVISSIVHIAHKYDNDAEPWPIEIEDHDGNLHAVSLEEGQMLFYESAKCLHGRRSLLKGEYYGSVFVHYQPVDTRIWNFTRADVSSNLPPHWNDAILEPYGSRWSGSGITVDSRVTENAPARTHNNTQPAFSMDEVFGNQFIEAEEQYTRRMRELGELERARLKADAQSIDTTTTTTTDAQQTRHSSSSMKGQEL